MICDDSLSYCCDWETNWTITRIMLHDRDRQLAAEAEVELELELELEGEYQAL